MDPKPTLSGEQFKRLVELAAAYVNEAERCAEVGCHNAACAMVGAALEAGLLATVCMFEGEIRAAGAWPVEKSPLSWELGQLMAVAVAMDWLPARLRDGTDDLDPFEHGDVGDVVGFVQYVRNVAIHPGRHVREMPGLPKLGEPAFENAYGIMRAAFDALHQVLARAIAEAEPENARG